MVGLKQIKSKIRSVERTQKVTKAMETVSASKMRKAQARALAARAYARAALAVLARVSGSRGLARHPLVRAGTKERALYIVITSDKGLAGALNSGVLRAVLAHIEAGDVPRERVSIIAVGRKAHDFFAARGFVVERYHPNSDISSKLIGALVQEASARFVSGAVDSVYVAYQNFVSTFEQYPMLRTVFPLLVEELQKVVADIVPARGAFSSNKTWDSEPQVLQSAVSNYSVEPGEAEVFDVILPKLAGVFVYHALLEHLASEHSARMVAMKSASDKAGDMVHALTLKFNKARQAAITREVSEIIGGMEALV